MKTETNELGQTVGFAVPNWQPCPRPPTTPLTGRFCRVEPLDIDRHAEDLHAANTTADEPRNWTYLPYGPFETLSDYRAWMAATCIGPDPMFHAVIDLTTGKAVGVASLMRMDPTHGVIETGHIHFSPLMQRGPLSTEAMYLLMARVFDELGYRRYEWKCNALNGPSVAAARRLGFTYEGTFRQMYVAKGRNRDTSWFSILDTEWPALKAAFQTWLDPANFDDEGAQRQRLSDLTATALNGLA